MHMPKGAIKQMMKLDGCRQDYIESFFKEPIESGKILDDDSDEKIATKAKILEDNSGEKIAAEPPLKWKWGTTHRHKVIRLLELEKNPKQILRALAGFTLKRRKPRKKKRRPKKKIPFQDCRPYHRILSRLESHTIFVALMHEDGRVISSASMRDGMLHWGAMRPGTSEQIVTPQELKNIALTLKANDRRVRFSDESRYAFALVQQRRFTSTEWILSPYIHHIIFSYLVEIRNSVDYMPSEEIFRPSPLTFGGHKMILRNIAQHPLSVQITAFQSEGASRRSRRSAKAPPHQTCPVFLFACRVRRFAVCVCKLGEKMELCSRIMSHIDFDPFFEFVHRRGLEWARVKWGAERGGRSPKELATGLTAGG